MIWSCICPKCGKWHSHIIPVYNYLEKKHQGICIECYHKKKEVKNGKKD